MRRSRPEEGFNSLGRFEFPLVLLLGLSLPFSAFPLAAWRGFDVDPPHVAAGVLLLAVLVHQIAGTRALPERRLLFATAALILLSMGGLAHFSDAGFQVGGFFKTGAHLVFMLLVFLAVGSVRMSRLRSLLAALAGLAVLIALYGIYQAWAIPRGWHSGIGLLSRFSVRPLRVSGYVSGVYRATGPFEEPSWLANYLLDAAVYAFFLALKGPSRRGRLGWSLAIMILFGGLVSTGSLGGIAAGSVLALVFVALGIARLHVSPTRRLAFLLLAAAVVGGLLLGLRETRFGRIFTTRAVLTVEEVLGGRVTRTRPPPELVYLATSGSGYFESARYSLCLWRSAPVVGVGLGQYHAARTRVRSCSSFAATDPWTGLAWCAETGLAGLLGLLVLLLSITIPSKARPAAADATRIVLGRLLILVFLLKQTHTGSYINLSSWYPMGLAAAATSGSFVSRKSRSVG